MRLIDADVVIKEITMAQISLETDNDAKWNMYRNYHKGLSWAHRIVLDAPTVTPVKHGKWIRKQWLDYEPYYLCSRCGKGHDQDYNFCNDCGARMDGGIVDATD